VIEAYRFERIEDCERSGKLQAFGNSVWNNDAVDTGCSGCEQSVEGVFEDECIFFVYTNRIGGCVKQIRCGLGRIDIVETAGRHKSLQQAMSREMSFDPGIWGNWKQLRRVFRDRALPQARQ
jgi:hypothetical protein